MVSKKMCEMLNKQVTNEFHASHTYLAMACKFDSMGLKGFAQWYFNQSNEERDHALKLINYMVDVDATVSLGEIKGPKAKFESAEEIIKISLDQEKEVTEQINKLMAQAETDDDYATRSFLKWFIDEQVEEVATFKDLLNLVQMAGPENLWQVEMRLETVGQGTESSTNPFA